MPRKSQTPPDHNPDWKAQADLARAEAALLPEGPAKDALLKKVRQLETASHLKEWIASSGLKSPKD